MKRNTLYLVAGVVVVAIIVIGYLVYREQNRSGIEVQVDDSGISVETH
jgi:hypothetical protein